MTQSKLSQRTEIFTSEDVIQGSRSEHYEDKFVVLNIDSLSEKFRTPENQIWLAKGGFGCDPEKMGRAVFANSLADGEHSRWDRGQFLGILKEELVEELGLRDSQPTPLCPTCKTNYLDKDEVMNALSRKDNQTYICSECATKEALAEMGL